MKVGELTGVLPATPGLIELCKNFVSQIGSIVY